MKFSHSKLLNSFSDITHAFTTKKSGNLAFHVGDNKADVIANHKRLAGELGYDKNSLVYMKQIHSGIVHVVSEEDFSTPLICDALITDKKNTPLMVMAADCSPMLFYDKKKKVIAVAHAGRQGAFKNITKNVIDCFTDKFKSDIENIYVSVGASIGVCCYEVGAEIYEEAKELGLEYAVQPRNGSFYLDVGAILKTQLLTCKIKEENIEFSNECTCCSRDKYFSYRAQKETGRFAGVIFLN